MFLLLFENITDHEYMIPITINILAELELIEAAITVKIIIVTL